MGLLGINWTFLPDRSSGSQGFQSSNFPLPEARNWQGKAVLQGALGFKSYSKCWLMEDQDKSETIQKVALVDCDSNRQVITVFQLQWITLGAVHLLCVP